MGKNQFRPFARALLAFARRNAPTALTIVLVLLVMPLSPAFGAPAAAGGPNLIPYRPDGWPQPLIFSPHPGDHSIGSLFVEEAVYVDLAIAPPGEELEVPVSVCLDVDRVQVNCWTFEGMQADTPILVEDWPLNFFPQAGSHFARVIVDPENRVAETDENDNTWGFDFTWVTTEAGLQLQSPPGPLLEDVITVPEGVRSMAAPDLSTAGAPGYYDTSVFMAGRVAVGIILPESNGAIDAQTENWTQTEIDQVISKIQAGMNRWTGWGGAAAHLSFVYDIQGLVPTSYEPISRSHALANRSLWMAETLAGIGFSAGTHYDRLFAYENALRSAYNTDWAFTIFVVDSSADADGLFSDGYSAFANLSGPAVVLTYDNGGWGIGYMDWVAAHETGHIFGAADQYYQANYGGCMNTTDTYGYLVIPNSNCEYNNPASIPSLMREGVYPPDASARWQIGWRDSDSDGIYDPLDTFPSFGISAAPANPSPNASLTYSASSTDQAWPLISQPTGCPFCYSESVTVNKITSAQFRVDGGDWAGVGTPADGAFDEVNEAIAFNTWPLGNGSHTVEMRSRNSAGNYSAGQAHSLTVNAPIPANIDDFASARIIPGIPYGDALSTTAATRAADDPNLVGCDRAAGLASVWYRYTPSASGLLYLDTFGSDYDAMIGIWTGTRGSLTEVACNDDVGLGIQSNVGLPVTAGVTYHIGVSQYNGAIGNPLPPPPQPGGNLVLHATSFQDVPGNQIFWRYIEGFYNQRITTGCQLNPRLYCPLNNVTRAEMAVFLLRARHGAGYVPPAATGIFSDVPVPGKQWMQPWIEQFYREGITSGCGMNPLRYCPEANVTRAEMAVFVLRAVHAPGWQPPASTGIFADVPVAGKEWMQPWIEQFYRQGITTGCNPSPLSYCPENNVTRQEMAVFISRAYGIPQLP